MSKSSGDGRTSKNNYHNLENKSENDVSGQDFVNRVEIREKELISHESMSKKMMNRRKNHGSSVKNEGGR